MKTIRHNVFETNSSSMHSITIHKHDAEDIGPVHFGICKDYDRYGRGTGEVLYSVYDKAEYWWTTICLNSNFEFPDRCHKISKKEKSYEVGNLLSFNDVKRLALSYIGGDCTFDDPTKIIDFYDIVSIDHESNNSELWAYRILESKEKFLDYLFGDGSVYLYSDCSEVEDELEADLLNTSPMKTVARENGESFDDHDKRIVKDYIDLQKKLMEAVKSTMPLPEKSEGEKMRDYVDRKFEEFVKAYTNALSSIEFTIGDSLASLSDNLKDISRSLREISENMKKDGGQ